jgi:lipid A 4'-phosphatase
MSFKKTFKKEILWPIVTMLMLTPWSGQLDRTVTDFFYRNGQFIKNELTQWAYQYGFYPAWIVAGLAALILISSFSFSSLKKWRRPALFLLMTLAVGPGLVVHTLLKDNWGRPRPKQVIEYGGEQPFRPYYKPNFFTQPEPSKSFPSGHCSMGFYFFTLAFLGKHYRKKLLRYFGMSLALGLGSLLSVTRIAQGGHFMSDTLMSGLIMWILSFGMYRLFFNSYEIPGLDE